jgi:tRNA (uracil-5-)-methyltransferase TRM9
MDAEVAQRLIALNKEFYQKLASQFSATRSRLQPGVLRVLKDVPIDANVLDLGCGNGGVAKELARRGHSGQYVGLDFSEELLEEARGNVQSPKSEVGKVGGLEAEFMQADLTKGNWNKQVSERKWDFIFAFAAMHHLPSREIRLVFLRQVSSLLASGARFVHSNWQFLNSPRLKARIQPWEAMGLSDKQMDDGDYLLDWRSGGEGLRYVHHFDEAELAELSKNSGFRIVEQFVSDGKSGNLAIYQTWEPL